MDMDARLTGYVLHDQRRSMNIGVAVCTRAPLGGGPGVSEEP